MGSGSNRFQLFAIVLLLGLLAGCSRSDTTVWDDNPDGRLQVVATFSIIEDLVNEIGGDRVALRTFVPREGDPHTFEATPSDNRVLSGADIVFEIGRGFEPWLNPLYRSSRSRAQRIVLTDDVELLPVPSDRGRNGEHDACDDSEKDPHIWHDVARTRQMVETIAAALAELDPSNAEVYASNTRRYLEELRELDAWILSRTETLPLEQRKLFTGHDVFRYFAQRYGFEVVGSALGATSTDVFDPAASQLRYQIRTLRAEQLPIVFPEQGSNPRLLTQIAQEAGASVGPSLYTGSLSRKGGEATSYIQMMRYNVDTLVSHLEPRQREL